MKKILSIAMAVALILGVFCMSASADQSGIGVYVTIADENGELALALEKITVADLDGDGKYTLDEALYAAHEAKFVGGAAAGYASEDTQWGISLMKLWGAENGGSYGYCVNDASAMGLGQELAEGDRINAYVYTDLVAWSDTYCFFDQAELTVPVGSEVTLTLMASGYDANWNPVTLPVAGATVTVNGADIALTDSEGKVTLTASAIGEYLISAKSESATLVPPATRAAVVEEAPATGIGSVSAWIAVFLLCGIALAAMSGKRNEN